MANYDEMLTRAIRALSSNTGAARREVYEKARAALVSELSRIKPALAARDITAHRLELEDHIRRVEQSESEAVIAGLSARSPDIRRGFTNDLASIIAAAERPLVSRTANGEAKPNTIAQPSTTEAPGNLASASTEIWSITARPTVFKKPRVAIEQDYASVMMPFTAELNPVFRAIQLAAKEAGFRLGRGDDIWEDQVIIEDIFSMIFRSNVVVCDFSGRNPNVFYEAGIAHTLGRHVIPIVQDRNDIPFDIRHHRYLEYKNTKSGRIALRRKLAERMRTILAQR